MQRIRSYIKKDGQPSVDQFPDFDGQTNVRDFLSELRKRRLQYAEVKVKMNRFMHFMLSSECE
jgi:hypothetical protein